MKSICSLSLKGNDPFLEIRCISLYVFWKELPYVLKLGYNIWAVKAKSAWETDGITML